MNKITKEKAQEILGLKGLAFKNWMSKHHLSPDTRGKYDLDWFEYWFDLPSIKDLMFHYKKDWYPHYKQTRYNYAIESLKGRNLLEEEEIKATGKNGFIGSTLEVIPDESPKGLAIQVMCKHKDCRKNPVISTTGIKKKCDHFNMQFYQARFFKEYWNEKKKRMSFPKVALKSRTWDGAYREAVEKQIEFENKKNKTVSVKPDVADNLTSFRDKYILKLKNEKREIDYVNTIERRINKFLFITLASAGKDAQFTQPREVDYKDVDMIKNNINVAKHKCQGSDEMVEYTSNGRRAIWQSISSFFIFINSNYPAMFQGITVPFAVMKNPYKKEVNTYEQNELSNEEFQKILAQMIEENLYEAQEKRLGHREITLTDLPYLKNEFYLVGMTAQRPETILRLKWENVYIKRDKMYIRFVNYKVSHQGQNEDNPNWQKTHTIECHPALRDFMMFLGYGKKSKEDYVIYSTHEQETDVAEYRRSAVMSRETMIGKVIRSFTYFAELAGVDATHGSLKKTACTDLDIHFGAHAHLYTGHSGGLGATVLHTNYTNHERSMSEKVQTFVPTLKYAYEQDYISEVGFTARFIGAETLKVA